MRRLGVVVAGLTLVVGGGLWATPAIADGATTAYVNQGHLALYYEGGGVNNHVSIGEGEQFQFVIDDQVPIAVGDGCVHPDASDSTYVVCTIEDSDDYWTGVYVDLGEGNDELWLRAGNENNISGGPGNDIIDVSENTIVRGDDGDDELSGGWYQSGGSGDDAMTNSPSGSIAYGDDGDDSFYGNAQDNNLRGGRGNDSFWGQAGADTIYGNSGDDLVNGGRGNDDLYGGPDADTVYGNSGDDSLDGGPGSDKLSGGPGTDTVHQD